MRILPQLAYVWRLIAYRSKKHGNECFRYHGTERGCRLGDDGHTTLCNSSSCSVCSILKTSFQVKLARSSGAWVTTEYYVRCFEDLTERPYKIRSRGVYIGRIKQVCQFVGVSSRCLRLTFSRSANYTTSGIMFLNKVVLGNVHHVSQFADVNSCPRGYQSVSINIPSGVMPEFPYV